MYTLADEERYILSSTLQLFSVDANNHSMLDNEELGTLGYKIIFNV